MVTRADLNISDSLAEQVFIFDVAATPVKVDEGPKWVVYLADELYVLPEI